jgi:hypothetical protein
MVACFYNEVKSMWQTPRIITLDGQAGVASRLNQHLWSFVVAALAAYCAPYFQVSQLTEWAAALSFSAAISASKTQRIIQSQKTIPPGQSADPQQLEPGLFLEAV